MIPGFPSTQIYSTQNHNSPLSLSLSLSLSLFLFRFLIKIISIYRNIYRIHCTRSTAARRELRCNGRQRIDVAGYANLP